MEPEVDLAAALVAKRDAAFLVLPADGALPEGEHPWGLYLDDCRHLSACSLELDGRPPRTLAASDARGDAVVVEGDAPGSVRVRSEWRIAGERAASLRVVVEAHGAPRRATLALHVGADLRNVLALRGWLPGPRGAVAVDAPAGATLRFAAIGQDDVRRATTVEARPAPSAADGTALRWDLALEPGVPRTVELRLALEPGPRPAASAPAPPEPPRLEGDDERFAALLERALADVALLRTPLDDGAYLAAGVPWYATLFGRDSIIGALQVLAFDPELAAGTLRLLAARIGRGWDAVRDEEPGKVLHEVRGGEGALTEFERSYSTVDATPLFLVLLAEHARWTGSLELARELADPVRAAAGWLDRELLTYERRAPGGLVSQGWKDSPDGIPGADGAPLAGAVAVVEAQGYAVAALRGLADLAAHEGDHAVAAALQARAGRHAAGLERLWSDERRHYGLALDGAGALSPVLATNQGHLLWSGAVPPGRVPDVAGSLMSPALFSGWGLRTLGTGERAYDPLAYHRGSVWPHDTALVAAGLRRAGEDAAFVALFDGLLDAAAALPGGRLPELFAGHAREPGMPPVPYPTACRPQAWAAGTLPFLLTEALGLRPDALRGRLVVERPLLPRPLRRLRLRGLRVGGARVDLAFERTAGGARLAAAKVVDGALEVLEA